MLCRMKTLPRRLDANQPNLVVEKISKKADRVRPSANAGDNGIGQAPELIDHLRSRLAADDALEFAHHRRKGMRASRRTEKIMGVLEARRPVAERFVDRVLERSPAAFDTDHFGAHHPHSKDVKLLSLDVV